MPQKVMQQDFNNRRKKTIECEGRESCFESTCFSLKNLTSYVNLVCKITAMTRGP